MRDEIIQHHQLSKERVEKSSNLISNSHPLPSECLERCEWSPLGGKWSIGLWVEGIQRSSTDSWVFLRAGVPSTRNALSHGKDDSGHHGCVGEVGSAPVDKRRCPFYSLLQGLCSPLTEFLFSLSSVMVPCLHSSSLRKGKGHPMWKCLSDLCS